MHLLTLLTFSKIAKNACVFSLKFGSLSSVSDFFRLHGPSVNFSLENGFFLLEPVEFRITFVLSWRTPETFVSSENERFCESLFLFLWIFITSEGLFHFGELLDIVRRWNSRVNYTGSEIKSTKFKTGLEDTSHIFWPYFLFCSVTFWKTTPYYS